MLNKTFIVKTSPQTLRENIFRWQNYKVSVLGARLFRLEWSPNRRFREAATQAVWYRNVPKQNFSVQTGEESAVIDTGECKLILHEDRGQVCVELNEKRIPLDNNGNLLGTYRTLDCCNGDVHFVPWETGDFPKKIPLSMGVCSTSGVAVIDDSLSLTLGEDGQVKKEVADGSDLYIFAYGEDYRAAVQALYALTGFPPLVPRFALGNWWSRYHAYTEEEYLRTLARFEEREIPLSVATVDMDWHYSVTVDKDFAVTASGKNVPRYVGECAVNLGWTGYTWNRKLFPNPRKFLKSVRDKGLKITLNLHPSDGVRFWEKKYKSMAKAVGMDASTEYQIPFSFTDEAFINAYFDILHRPLEKEGVDFWWIDWQQPNIPFGAGEYDPLWALNHYHYLDKGARSETPLILSRYAGIGSHRYPLGFSGDTAITWQTLAYLPYFTATASNIGYTWWSHDVGGHNGGEKKDELYLRHLQFGVFSPVNRLHCSFEETMTKEPWAYGNGTGELAEKFLRLRHKLVPYLYTASYRSHKGRALIEPLYYEWKEGQAYEYSREYLFGSELLVCPVVTPVAKDGYARVKAWLPEGKWTDIFTGEEYAVGVGGKELTLHRGLNSIPVLIKKGGILPLSLDKGNGCNNPKRLEIWVYTGDGEYTLYEDGKEQGKGGVLQTELCTTLTKTEGVCTQTLQISTVGDWSVIPKNRRVFVRFKNVAEGEVSMFVNGERKEIKRWITDCPALQFPLEEGNAYRVEVTYAEKSRLEKWKVRAEKILLEAEGDNGEKYRLYCLLQKAASFGDCLAAISASAVTEITKLRLREGM